MTTIVTIDGPAGAGKTTISKRLAERLGFRYVDTGALYRAVALAAKREGLGAENDNAVEKLLPTMTVDLPIDRPDAVLLNNEDVSGEIRTPAISKLASGLSAKPFVRNFLLSLQRQLGESKNAVFEGRDTGTVIFPHATVKFFLSATPEARAKRRYLELVEKGMDVRLEDIERDMILRDQNDSTRDLAPLKPAEDAILIDSTAMTMDEVVNQMAQIVTARL